MKEMHMKYLKFYKDHEEDICAELYKITRWFKDEEEIQGLLLRVINVLLLEQSLSVVTDVYTFKTEEDFETVFFHKLADKQNVEYKLRMYVLQDSLMFEWMLVSNKNGSSMMDYSEYSCTLKQAKLKQRKV